MSRSTRELAVPFTVPLSWCYRGVINLRNRKFDRGHGVQTLDRPVISVGNITTGGTGKTPIVAWIARQLLEVRMEPLIAMRGYKAVGGVSDEQAEYLQMLPDAHVVANPNRASAIRKYLQEHSNVQVTILDDGFQHRQIKRDLDLVLIDASAETFDDRLLPAGNLREPVENLRRADAVIVTHADAEISNLKSQISHLKSHMSDLKSQISDLKSQIEKHHGKPPIALCKHVWTRLDIYHNDGARVSREAEWLSGQRIITMLGIGKPEPVMRQLRSAGAEIIQAIPVRDHQRYRHNSLDGIDKGPAFNLLGLSPDHSGEKPPDALVVTQKDWVKLEKVIDWKRFSLPIVVPRLAIEFVEGEADLLDLLMQRARTPSSG